MKRHALVAFLSLVMALATQGSSPRAQSGVARSVDWPLHNLDLAGSRFSSLDKINTTNVKSLTPRWLFQHGVIHNHNRVRSQNYLLRTGACCRRLLAGKSQDVLFRPFSRLSLLMHHHGPHNKRDSGVAQNFLTPRRFRCKHQHGGNGNRDPW